MAIQIIKNELTKNEFIFMERMTNEILPNRKHVDTAKLKEVGALVNIQINTSCRTCSQSGGVDMLNLYGQLKPIYDELKKISYESPIEEQIIESPVIESQEVIEEVIEKPIKKKVVKK